MAGFLTNLGLAAGRNILYGQEFQERQDELDLRKQQVEMGKLALGNAQRQQQTQAEVGSFLQSEMQKDAANFTDPANAVKEYSKAAGIALSSGDFVTANAMADLAKGKTLEAKDALIEQQKQLQMKKEDLSSTAGAYADNPTPENAQQLVQKAIAAGVNPTTIPPDLKSPAGRKWVNEQTMASMSGKERIAHLEKVTEFKQNQQRMEQAHQDSLAERDLQRRQTAVYQNGMLQLRQAELAAKGDRMVRPIEINGNLYERDPSMTIKGDRDTNDPALVKIGEKLTSQQKGGVSRGSFAAAEITRTLQNVQDLNPSAANSPFAHLGAHTAFDALVKMGSTALTPDQSRMINVAAAGMGNQIASLDASLGGRMAAGVAQEHLQDAAIRQAGESGFTAAYKLANTKEMTETAIRFLPGNYAETPKGKKQLEDLEKAVPFSTRDVLKAMEKEPGASDARIRELTSTFNKMKANLADEASKVGGGAVGLHGQGGGEGQVNRPPLPAGGVPADIQSLVDKYRSK